MDTSLPNKKVPSLYEWMGGMEVFEKLMVVFYKKVLDDALLAPVFGHMSPDHQRHVAQFVAEVFGGPPAYSSPGGSHAGMIRKHVGRHLKEEQRQQWVRLLLESADEIKVPDDPEFRSAFVAYIEWGTRLAVMNSNIDQPTIKPDEPMPKWGWGVPGGPYVP